ncbi:Lrp/AsnC family transcriptional regulator [Agrobacterium sp. 33MFTa1.1]|nr:winged helix-turn-helix transcriptional regulator [Agrobacterium pusense]PZU78588.1 MAG: Lrp/AsnC family transcriptional regulator [Rhizobium sp.]QBJ13514.1 Lrp/AsnC family transcriptional regulator [Agrobacterium sp. 33MFTa1.1]RAL97469.1 Lrp/AsnC family transcriptional regulator [Agrobacterium sp. MS2]RSC36244.1 Lrp/AsnC family transcriptional regulator [Agrobacterium sp. FDAARGOS_525]TGR71078.1 Lrp/AsnC family transcriptional regulator [bacterium M00.F.Ca.ET.194.01.1.1]TGS55931.1 Lrp/Asn
MRYQQGSCGCTRNFVTGWRHIVANPAPNSTRKFSSLTRYSSVTSVELDAIDLKILRELQRDGRMTNVELAERVGISAPPCLRRVRKLEEAGVIEGYHAMLNAPKLGFDLVAFCMIGLKRQSDSNLKAFAAATAGWPLVRQAWMVSGESDFLLHCVARNLTEFQDFVIEVLTADENVDTVRTMLTIRQVKRVGLVEI